MSSEAQRSIAGVVPRCAVVLCLPLGSRATLSTCTWNTFGGKSINYVPPSPIRRPPLCGVRALQTTSSTRSDAVASYSPKIEQLVKDIAGLTLLEVSDLNELLKKTLNIQDVGMMPMGAMAAAAPVVQAAEEEAAPQRKEKTHFTVKLTELKAADKVKLIKEVKNCMQGLNLVQAKKLVETLPQEIRANVSKEEAEKLKAALEAAGGTVVLE
uniref:Large ribosomal subunit protein bL12m n=1 Tax=Scleropages formosus TaxID=113540 RepID=A0A8C9SPW9_SCLFO